MKYYEKARPRKRASLDDGTVGKQDNDLSSNLLFKRSDSLKGQSRRHSKEHRSHELRKP